MKQNMLFILLVVFLTACNVEEAPKTLPNTDPITINLSTSTSDHTIIATNVSEEPTNTPTASYTPTLFPTPTVTPEPTETVEVKYPYSCTSIVDISLVDDKNGWAVVDCIAPVGIRTLHKGLVYRLTDGRWQLMSEAPVLGPPYSCYKAVSAVSAEEMWAVGFTAGVYICQFGNWLLHYKDGKWETVDVDPLFIEAKLLGANKTGLVDIEMLDADNGWAIGHGTILRYQQDEWSIEFQLPLNENHWYDDRLYAISMTDLNNGWAVGEYRFYRYQDGQWNYWEDPLFETAKIRNIHTISKDEAWAVGSCRVQENDFSRNDPCVWHYLNDRWQGTTLPVEYGMLTDIKMINNREGWAIGSSFLGSTLTEGSIILHYSDGQWRFIPSPSGYASLSVDAINSGRAWIGIEQFYYHQISDNGYRDWGSSHLAPGGYWGEE